MDTILDHCRDLPVRHVAVGERLMEEGADGGRLYVLVEGAFEVLKGDVVVAKVREPGAVFGELGILLGRSPSATVRALAPSRLHVVDDPQVFLASPDIGLHVARLLAKRLHLMTSYLADVQRQFAEHESHLGMMDEVLAGIIHFQDDLD